MIVILKTLFNNPWVLSALAGISVFISFERFNLVGAILFFPFLFTLSCWKVKSFKQSLALGFLASSVIMLGGFYWITYVVHEFGQLSWGLSGLLFLVFCGFGALNFPIFSGLLYLLKERLLRSGFFSLWVVLGIPALFTAVEWAIPKLFPWYIGHCLYKQLWFIQLTEYTGSSLLTFTLFSLGLALPFVFLKMKDFPLVAKSSLLIPVVLVFSQVLFSIWTNHYRTFEVSKEIKIGLVQANIGNLEKVAAKKNLLGKVDFTIETYQKLTEEILPQNPDLILWPETAVPFQLDSESSRQKTLVSYFQKTGVPFVVGAYAKSPQRFFSEYNAAFLVDPAYENQPSDIYYKNILLAFGEYLPLGASFPWLYGLFPQVSDFERGTEQNAFILNSQFPLGISICYEAIVPSFMRKVAANKVQAFVNLTNDSWFGPTSEPYLHGALSVFRTIEHRVPLARVTNTGASFVIDHLGRMGSQTQIFKPATLVQEMKLIRHSKPSFYSRFGDWVVGLLALMFILLFFGDLSVSLSR